MFPQTQIYKRCDAVMAFGFYALIFFIPISPAIVEILFGVIFISFNIKRTFYYLHLLKTNSQKSIKERGMLFLRAFKPVSTPINTFLGFYFLSAVVSIVFSFYPVLSFQSLFFKLLEGMYFYFMFVECITSKKQLRIFFSVFLASFAVITTNGIFQYVVREGFIHHYPITDGRVTSSFKHANNFSPYLLMFLPLLLQLTLFFSPGELSRKFENESLGYLFLRSYVFKILCGFLLFSGLVCLGLTYSRSAWLALSVSFFLLGIKRPWFLCVVGILIVIFGLVFIPKMVIERTSNIVIGIFTASDRGVYWSSAIQLIKERPFFGVGLNAYSNVARDFQLKWAGYPHNCYLQMAAEVGLVGLSFFLLSMGKWIKYGVQQLRKIQDESIKLFISGCIFGMIGYLIHSFFDTNFYSVQLDSLMWVMMGVMTSAIQSEESCEYQLKNKEEYSNFLRKRDSVRKKGTLIFIVLLLVVCFFQRHKAVEQYGLIYYTMATECKDECSEKQKLEYLFKVIKHKPDFARAYYDIGELYDKKGQLELATEYYYKTLEIDPEDPKACLAIGKQYFYQKDIDTALTYFLKGFKDNKGLWELPYYIGRIFESRKKYGTALKWIYRARYYNSNFPEAYAKLAVMEYLNKHDTNVEFYVNKLRELKRPDLADKLQYFFNTKEDPHFPVDDLDQYLY